MDIQAFGPERVGRYHAVKRVAGLVNDGLAAVDHLEGAGQGWRRAHHRRGLPVDNASLLTIRGGAVHLGPGLVVGQEHVESDAGQRGRFALLLGQLDVANAMLPCAVRLETAEELTEHTVLPGQELEVLTGLPALAVAQDLLKEMHNPFVLGLPGGRQVRHRGL